MKKNRKTYIIIGIYTILMSSKAQAGLLGKVGGFFKDVAEGAGTVAKTVVKATTVVPNLLVHTINPGAGGMRSDDMREKRKKDQMMQEGRQAQQAAEGRRIDEEAAKQSQEKIIRDQAEAARQAAERKLTLLNKERELVAKESQGLREEIRKAMEEKATLEKGGSKTTGGSHISALKDLLELFENESLPVRKQYWAETIIVLDPEFPQSVVNYLVDVCGLTLKDIAYLNDGAIDGSDQTSEL